MKTNQIKYPLFIHKLNTHKIKTHARTHKMKTNQIKMKTNQIEYPLFIQKLTVLSLVREDGNLKTSEPSD